MDDSLSPSDGMKQLGVTLRTALEQLYATYMNWTTIDQIVSDRIGQKALFWLRHHSIKRAISIEPISSSMQSSGMDAFLNRSVSEP
ncbi:hypothetical protein MWU49_02590 [Alcanivorax sp. S6407]|uniref:hypothetical protein n=1 Tax=Alcanivorax sp. S6407 TaxID=2926424 RepID=UPI001FF39274|nr:hypothetical protein [Alcanivorax sp. S6407]MCK0152580.1 hypothetical protein [Alcanivorax sp. S6407]